MTTGQQEGDCISKASKSTPGEAGAAPPNGGCSPIGGPGETELLQDTWLAERKPLQNLMRVKMVRKITKKMAVMTIGTTRVDSLSFVKSLSFPSLYGYI